MSQNPEARVRVVWEDDPDRPMRVFVEDVELPREYVLGTRIEDRSVVSIWIRGTLVNEGTPPKGHSEVTP